MILNYKGSCPDFRLEYATPFSAGVDVISELPDFFLMPSVPTLVDTQVFITVEEAAQQIGAAYYFQYLRVAPKSGLALQGVDTMAGVIDFDFPLSIQVVLINLNSFPVQILRHSKVAQLIVERAGRMPLPIKLSKREGGFGSTDK